MKIHYLLEEAKYYRKVSGLKRAIKKFFLTQTFLSKWVNSEKYQKIYSKAIDSKVKNPPKILQIENTNACNANCIMCPHNKMKRKVKVMGLKEFEKILDNVMEKYNIERLTITGFGEPFADKGILEKIKYVNSKYPLLKIEIYTNASLLTKDVSNNLLDSKIEKITFSVNGTAESYQKVVGLNYLKTKENLIYFLKENEKRKKKVLTNISMMLLEENQKNTKAFINFWAPLADSVRVYAPSNWAGELKEIIQKTPFKKNKRWPCFALWNNITVDVKGNMVLCCRDYESKVKFGNLLEEDITKIRNSEQFQKLLKNQREFNFNSPICNHCDNSFDSSLDWIC